MLPYYIVHRGAKNWGRSLLALLSPRQLHAEVWTCLPRGSMVLPASPVLTSQLSPGKDKKKYQIICWYCPSRALWLTPPLCQSLTCSSQEGRRQRVKTSTAHSTDPLPNSIHLPAEAFTLFSWPVLSPSVLCKTPSQWKVFLTGNTQPDRHIW